MRVGIAIAVLAGAGFALAQAGGAPELRAVSAPADGIAVLELDSGRTVRTLPWRELRVLER